MSTKLIHVPELKGSRVSVRYDTEYDEFRVLIAGRDAATYYTDNMQDALEIAIDMAIYIDKKLTGKINAPENATGEFTI